MFLSDKSDVGHRASIVTRKDETVCPFLRRSQMRTPRAAAESGPSDGTVFEARESVLEGINGNVLLTVCNTFLSNLNIHRTF